LIAAHDLLEQASVAANVFELRPDYRAVIVVVSGLRPDPNGEASEALASEALASEALASEALLRSAEDHARAAQADSPVEHIAHVAAWRDAYRAFGAKPQRTRNSLEALMRRAHDGLPRVNRLTDLYNAISVLHQIPCGGEDLSSYVGAPQLVRATGDEVFETMVSGERTAEHPEVGEVVWRDDEGVTCRRWNWLVSGLS